MKGKRQSKVKGKVNRKRLKTKVKPVEVEAELVEVLDALPPDGTTVPAVPAPSGLVYAPCSVHPDIKYRVGGFCEKCYGEETKNRIMKLDAQLDETVLINLDALIERILESDDLNLIERFIGRMLKRFSRPETKHVKAQLQAVHLHGPVDFGRPQ